MRPEPDEVLHFSEDPTITRFEPHVAATARHAEAYVWAVDAALAPAYWFPRQCPRAMAWVVPGTTVGDRERILGPGGGVRVHAIEYGWLERLRTVSLFAYRFPAAQFRPFGDAAYVSTRPWLRWGRRCRWATCCATTRRRASNCGCCRTCGSSGTR